MKVGPHRINRYLFNNEANTISLRLLDQNGEELELELSVEDAGEIAATVPFMLSKPLPANSERPASIGPSAWRPPCPASPLMSAVRDIPLARGKAPRYQYQYLQ